MNYLLMVLGAFICFVIAVFGGSQIVGSIEHIRKRPILSTIITITIWAAVLTGCVLAILKWFAAYKTVFLIAMGVGILMSCRHQE